VSYARITRRVMQALPELRIAVKYGVGYDNLDTVAAAELGIFTVNVPDYCVEEVALQALSLILTGLRRVPFFASEVKRGHWISDPSAVPIHRLSGINLGLVGFGRIARKLAECARPMVKEVRYFDPNVSEAGDAVRCMSIEELVSTSAILSVHAPLTPQTRSLIGARQLSDVKGLIVVNTSRAAVVDQLALRDALRDGRVAFYAADTHWEEPADMTDAVGSELLALDNVLVTPHMGWYSVESEKEVRKKAAMEIARVIRGERPLHIVS
jgi:D-3-phosphoglycerate dehydrogenase / 2-oxoglutarate reductase